MARLLLFLVLGGYLMYGITNVSLNRSVTNATENSVTSFSYNQAKNIAHSTVQMIISRLGDNLDWRVTTPTTIDLYGGYATYTVVSDNPPPGNGEGDDDDDDDDDGHNGDDDDDDGHNGDDDDDDGHNGDDDDDDGGHGKGKGHGKGHSSLLRLGSGDDFASLFYSYLEQTNSSNETTETSDVTALGVASVYNILSESLNDNFELIPDGDDDDDDGHSGDDDDDDGHNGDDDDDDGHNGDDDDDDGHNGDDDDDDGGGGSSNSEFYQNIKIAVTAYYNGVTKSVSVLVKGRDFNQINIPVTVKAAVTTNNPVQTLGSLTVDGRDHNLSGGLKSNHGIFGMWTTSSLNQSGASKIGGTFSELDYPPNRPADPSIVLQNQSWPGGFPDNPDEVLGGSDAGYPEGTLKHVAQLGLKGSQYVTDPTNLNYPLKGITYVDLPSGEIWNSAKVEGEGILIVHNSDKSAVIKNLRSHYNFKGLIIADDIVHIHNQILGAVFVLTDNPSEGNCIGNGSGDILYSTEALKGVLTESEKITKTNYGFGKPRLQIVHWYEKNYNYKVQSL